MWNTWQEWLAPPGQARPGLQDLRQLGSKRAAGRLLAISSAALGFIERLVRSLVMTPWAEDWRHWVMHVTDNQGEEIFDLPFNSILGKLH